MRKRHAALAIVGVAAFVLALWTCQGQGHEDAPSPAVVRDQVAIERTRSRAAPREPAARSADAAGGATAPAEFDQDRATERLAVLVVADATGEPVAGSHVIRRTATGGVVASADTDAQGRAVLVGVGAGPHVLEVPRPAGREDLQRIVRVVVWGSGERTVRIPNAVFLRGTFRVDGRRPAHVMLLGRRTDGAATEAESQQWRIPVAEDGTFADQVEPGRYHVWTEASGPAGTSWAVEHRHDVDPTRDEVRIDLRAADGFACVLRSEGVSGDGLLATAHPSPSGATIAFRDTPSDPAFAAPVMTLRVAAGVEHDVWAKVATSAFAPAAGWGVVRRALPGTRVEIPVRPAWRLRLTLVDSERRPVRAAVPYVAWPEGSDLEWVTCFGATGTTSADGEAVIEGLPPLPVTLLVGGPGATWSAAGPRRVEPGTDSVVVEVAPTVALRGRLVDAAGKPVHAELRIRTDWPGARTLTTTSMNSVGTFEFRGLLPGRVRVTWAVDGLEVGPLGEVDLPASGVVTWIARVP